MVLERWTPRRGLRRWHPAREIRDIWDEMDRLWQEMWGESLRALGLWRRPLVEEKDWMPAVDMYEKGDNYVIKAELPGMKEVPPWWAER